MKREKKVFTGIIIFCFCLFVTTFGNVFAQEETSSETGQQTDYKGEISSDRQAISEQKSAIKEHSTSARQEEAQLKQQINEAMQSGDKETAAQLREQLKSTHQANVQQKQQDIETMRGANQEFKQDVQGARQEGNLPPKGQKILLGIILPARIKVILPGIILRVKGK